MGRVRVCVCIYFPKRTQSSAPFHLMFRFCRWAHTWRGNWVQSMPILEDFFLMQLQKQEREGKREKERRNRACERFRESESNTEEETERWGEVSDILAYVRPLSASFLCMLLWQKANRVSALGDFPHCIRHAGCFYSVAAHIRKG